MREGGEGRVGIESSATLEGGVSYCTVGSEDELARSQLVFPVADWLEK
jgi:hypothetical protein